MKTAYIVGSIILIIVIITVTWGFSSNWGTVNSNNKNLHQNNKNLRNDLDLVKQQVLQLNNENQKIIDNNKKLKLQLRKTVSKEKTIPEDNNNSPTPSVLPSPSSSSGGTGGTGGTGSTGKSSMTVEGPKGEPLETTPKKDSTTLTNTIVLKGQTTEGVGYVKPQGGNRGS
jgi:hypothetical protein